MGLTKKQELKLSSTIRSGIEGLRKCLGVSGTPEEVLLAAKAKGWSFTKIEEAREKLIDACYPWALNLANRMLGKLNGASLEKSDIYQAALMGLMKAALRFDARLSKWSTYCTWWVRQSITRTMNDESRTIRIPVYLCCRSDYKEKFKKIVHHTEIPVEDPEVVDLHGELERLLTDRELTVIKGRFFTTPRVTLKTLGRRLSLSRERIRQIELQALKILSDSNILKDEYDALH